MALASVYNIGMGIASLFPSRYGVRRPFILAMDTMLIAVWMELTHRWELMAFYFVVVIVAAMWYRVLGGVLAAAVCDFLFLFLWGRQAANADTFVLPVFTPSLALNVVLLFVVGALAGYLAEAQERERERRLERELLIANYQQEIDVSTHLQPLLVSRFEANANLDLGAAMHSARALGGGDYLDALPLPEGRTLLCVADVSGKSVRAQARVPLLKYSLRALAPLHPDPAALAARLQITLAPELGPEIYIALCLVVLDPKNETLTWCNAGHMAPLRVRKDETLALETTSPALGLFPEIAPQQSSRPWERGDALLLFTDGLADALSFGGEADGEEQVQKLAARLSHDQARPAVEAAQELVDLASAALHDKPFLSRHFSLGDKRGARVRRDDVAVLVARFCA
ncbi:MAG: serine/threonine-protein phosphatase, partial [Armatimonadetes bacterium]|nr:serine/threonine-protein phosphatase [Armatimonadota bacterium]